MIDAESFALAIRTRECTQVGHLALAVQKRMLIEMASRKRRGPDDLPKVINREAEALLASECPDVDHLSIAVKEGMRRGGERRIGRARNLTRVVDRLRQGVSVRAARGAQIDQFPILEQKTRVVKTV